MQSNAQSGDERRRFVRYILTASAKLAFDDGETGLGKVEDVSTGGAFLQFGYTVARMNLERKGRISINAIIQHKVVTFEADFKVVRVTSSGVGVLFESLDATNKKILFNLVDELNRLLRESRTTGDT